MTSGQSPLQYAELLKNTPFASLLAHPLASIPTTSVEMPVEQSSQQAFQARLIQTVIEEKLKNEILLTTVLINTRIIELQNHLVMQSQGGPSSDKSADQAVMLKQEEGPISSEPRTDPTAEDSDCKRPSGSKKIKNETKNIPKNYGKAIISFI